MSKKLTLEEKKKFEEGKKVGNEIMVSSGSDLEIELLAGKKKRHSLG
jgi:hypothetical protein